MKCGRLSSIELVCGDNDSITVVSGSTTVHGSSHFATVSGTGPVMPSGLRLAPNPLLPKSLRSCFLWAARVLTRKAATAIL